MSTFVIKVEWYVISEYLFLILSFSFVTKVHTFTEQVVSYHQITYLVIQ